MREKIMLTTKNKCVLAFVNQNNITVKYGKWFYSNRKLYFNYILIAEKENNITTCYDQKLVDDCNFEHNTKNAIDRVINFLKK